MACLCYIYGMLNQFSRFEMLVGKNSLEKLKNSKIALFGLGGVGGYALEALVRCGVGKFDLIDNDKISPTNLNRQLFALYSTLDRFKTEAAKERMLDINPDVIINVFNTFYLPEKAQDFDFKQYDYVIDAIDTISAKISLIEECEKVNTPIISSMGAGNKLHPEMFEIADIYDTSVCPLAKVIRQELRKRDIKKLKVVYSKEKPVKIKTDNVKAPSSCAFVPSAAGLIIAGAVVRDLIS